MPRKTLFMPVPLHAAASQYDLIVELCAYWTNSQTAGAILIFVPGWGEIKVLPQHLYYPCPCPCHVHPHYHAMSTPMPYLSHTNANVWSDANTDACPHARACACEWGVLTIHVSSSAVVRDQHPKATDCNSKTCPCRCPKPEFIHRCEVFAYKCCMRASTQTRDDDWPSTQPSVSEPGCKLSPIGCSGVFGGHGLPPGEGRVEP